MTTRESGPMRVHLIPRVHETRGDQLAVRRCPGGITRAGLCIGIEISYENRHAVQPREHAPAQLLQLGRLHGRDGLNLQVRVHEVIDLAPVVRLHPNPTPLQRHRAHGDNGLIVTAGDIRDCYVRARQHDVSVREINSLRNHTGLENGHGQGNPGVFPHLDDLVA